MDKNRFFLYDPEGDGFETFPTIEERDAAAEKAIPLYCDDGWLEEVQDVAMGEITHVATEVDRVDRPSDYDLDEDDFDEQGTYWAPGQEYMCNYKMLPISKHMTPLRIQELSRELPDDISDDEFRQLIAEILIARTTMYRLQKIHTKITGKSFDA